jgi:putative phage-type endonuclease
MSCIIFNNKNMNFEIIDYMCDPYFIDTDTDTDTDTEIMDMNLSESLSERDEEYSSFIHSLSEDDLLDMDYEINISIFDYFSDIKVISNPRFIEFLTESLTHDMIEACSYFLDLDKFDTHFDEIYTFVQERINNYVDTIMELPRSYKNTLIINENQDKKLLMEKIKRIRSCFQPEQRTTEWYEYRHNLLTASNIDKLLGSDAKINSLIYEKCKPLVIFNSNSVNVNSPMHWGNKYEPVSIMIYEYMYNTAIEDFGCLQHPTIHCLGASPDGINTDINNPRFGRMIEVKNIFNRDITGVPLEAYWMQMQIQMEVCDLNECDFIETRIKEFDNEEDFYSHHNTSFKGVILYFVSKTEIGSKPYYHYMPISFKYYPEMITSWIDDMKLKLSDDFSLYETLYWYVDEISIVLIPRNKAWFNEIVPNILSTWDLIKYERIHGYEHRQPKRNKKEDARKLYQKELEVIKLDGIV